MSVPAYPAYKDSGVEWIGMIPEHWEIRPFKAVVGAIESGTSVNSEDRPASLGELGVLKTSCVYTGEFDSEQNKVVVSDELERVSCPIRKNSLIVSRMNTPDLVGAAGLVRECKKGIFLPDRLWQLTLKDCYPPFVHYWTHSATYRGQVKLACSGASSSMQNLSQGQLLSFDFLYMPVAEHRAIAAFLDQETGKIDALVAEQERLMALLKEKRQAVISHAVTKGLDANAPMKRSGVEWLGDVPAHWEVRRVKTVSTFITSGPRGWSDRVGEEGSLFIQSGDLDDALEVDFAGAKRVQTNGDAEAPRTQLYNGDVVVCITGAKTGNVALCAVVPEAAYINQHLCLIRPANNILPKFLGILLKSKLGQNHFEISQYGLKQGLSLEDVRDAPVFLPPIAEQLAIVSYLHAQTSKLDTLNSEAERAITLLKERRAALISAAVTGKIDVRGLVPGVQEAA